MMHRLHHDRVEHILSHPSDITVPTSKASTRHDSPDASAFRACFAASLGMTFIKPSVPRLPTVIFPFWASAKGIAKGVEAWCFVSMPS